MPDRARKHPSSDPNVLAHSILDAVTDDGPRLAPPAAREKNPAAVALGRLGGLKGGVARAKTRDFISLHVCP